MYGGHECWWFTNTFVETMGTFPKWEGRLPAWRPTTISAGVDQLYGRCGSFLIVIMGSVRNYVIDSRFVMVGSRPAASSAINALELSVSIRKWCKVAPGRLSKSECIKTCMHQNLPSPPSLWFLSSSELSSKSEILGLGEKGKSQSSSPVCSWSRITTSSIFLCTQPVPRVVCTFVTSDKVHVYPIRVNVLLTLNRVYLDLLCS
jgi:hypothetical protein